MRRRYPPLAVLLASVVPGVASAATLTVVNTSDSGAGSLRQAILDANANAGADTIAFAIPGGGPFTIAPASRLPTLRGALTIDGYTQAGSRPNALAPEDGALDGVLRIEIRGPGNDFGFVLGTDPPADVTLRGLAIGGYGPLIGGGGATTRLTIHGSYLGTTLDGMAAVASVSAACVSVAGVAQIGGTLPAQRNLVANCGNGAIVAGSGVTVIEGNLIGTDASGERALAGMASNNAGIVVNAGNGTPQLRIGGTSANARNVISGHERGGIGLFGSLGFDAYALFQIHGNYIGTDWTGARAVPNGLPDSPQFTGGIVLWRVSTSNAPAIVGGFGAGEANLIAYNYGAGIFSREARNGESYDQRGNRVYRNRGVGRANLDIAPAGPTANDAGDTDTGANNRQNWPQIEAASLVGSQLAITYRVDTTTVAAAYPLRVDFYADVQGGSGALLGQDVYPAAAAQQSRTIVLAVLPGTRALPFVAVATDADGYSSEFSPAFDVIFEDDFE